MKFSRNDLASMALTGDLMNEACIKKISLFIKCWHGAWTPIFVAFANHANKK